MKKILYVYRTARKENYLQVLKRKEPDHILYGLNHFLKKGYQVEFSDIGYSKRNILFWLFLPIQMLIIINSSIGFKLDQALLLIPKIINSDIVITTADSAGLPILFLKKLIFFKKAVIYISTGLANELNLGNRNWLSSLYLDILNQSNQIVCHSFIEKQLLCQMNPKLKDKITVIPFGIDYDYFHQKRDEKDYIFSLGQDRSRDFGLLAKLSLLMKNQKFIIITQKSSVKEIKFGKNVKIFYNLPYAKVKNYFLGSKIVIIPLKELNRASGQISFLESVASRNKVVVASIKGLDQVYPDLFSNKNLFGYKAGDIKSLQHATIQALEAKTGKVKFPAEYKSKNYAAAIEKIIERL